ncbi:MAG TPA: polyphosphate polymerase domain-containing protein [Bacilli bacterium]|nr:polyphosphate polymerase domain-containing protein [Bacilli bacterium]
MAITTFRRVEKKYVVTEEDKQKLLPILREHMALDPYCLNEETYHIQNLYFDTAHNSLIVKSIAKPLFKEKVRLRKYDGEDFIYLEIKKKVVGVVGKRRIRLSQQEGDDFIFRGIKPIREAPLDIQLVEEMSYFLSLYRIEPKVYICYDRLGFFDKDDPEFRLTFDSNIHSRRNHFEWDKDDYENNLLPKGYYVMEIKSVKNLPLWLVQALSHLKIYPQSYSKYGTEYQINHR